MDAVTDKILLNRFVVEERPLRRLADKCDLLCRPSAPDAVEMSEAALKLEFAQYKASLRRLELTNKAHAREVQRYTEKEAQVLALQEETRQSIAKLRIELEEAEGELEDKNAYDALAKEILARHPRSRASQKTAIAMLQEEIAQLVKERDATQDVWRERKRAFDEIFHALQRMAADIRGEKEDAERKAGMADSDEEEDGLIKEKPVQSTETVEVEMAEAGEIEE
ncbi:hypothetical protein BCR37DRAFT_376541 [Protomyces lactucae-debilis]|uniref:Tho complex subunit 7-domain-containing protein n=1 Tax=Protomyces lactucae-debilis TaxID=2754530 RepID=A0A1Y2FT35_PROLT|nr:uncharacterized protein BCR37DRAFT_376541 [Protomyces lactucae-debilis]ORY87138.1 hypothetical protein BCR37DRAFT_376541 [Protomyces lactucae-debilis]